GRFGIGTSNPQVTLDLATADAVIIPHGATADRPATGAAGMLRYNSSTSIDSIDYYDAQTSTWQRIATATDATTAAGADTQVQFNSGGSFGADADYTWNMTTNVLTIANSGTGAVRAGNGAVGAPSLSFTADPNTGLYNIAADTIGFATNGAEVARMTTGQVGLVAGAVGAPAYSFTGDLNTGLYNVGADALGVAANGVNYMTVQAPGATDSSVIFGGSAAVTMPSGAMGSRPSTGVNGMIRYNTDNGKFEAYQAGAWQDILTSGGGAITAAGANTQIQFNSGGVLGADADYTWDMTNNVLTIANSGTGAVRAGNGAVGTPSLSFTADPNTGLYNIAADTIGFATNGAEVARMTTGQVGLVAGAVGAPAYSFTGDLNTGLYNVGADALGVAANGVNYLTIQAPGAANAAAIFGGTSAITLPSGTTAERPSTGTAGMLRYNSSTSIDSVEYYDAQTSTWQRLATATDATTAAGANTQVQFNSGGSFGADADYTWDMTNNVLTIANSGTGAVRVGNGAVGTPSLSFTGDTNTGLYNVGADAIGVAANGVNYMTVQAPGATDSSVIFGGGAAVTMPSGATGSRPSTGVNGMIRYNTTNGKFEGYQAGAWQDILTGSASAAAPDRGIQFNSGGSFAAVSNLTYTSSGDLIVGSYQMDGTGSGNEDSRMFFNIAQSAFRAGFADGTEWDNANIGFGSVAMGLRTIASGADSVAMGSNAVASGNYSVAMGQNSAASGDHSVALNADTIASGFASTALGSTSEAAGARSFAVGNSAKSYGENSVAIGDNPIASGISSLSMGRQVTAGNGTAGNGLGDGSVAMGLIDNAVTITTASQVTGIQSMGIFMGDQDGLVVSANNQMGLFGGKMVIDPAVPATQLTARGVLDVGAATD
ncbi:MAG: hypothetical protein HYU57_08305, partial [Micavibrio aeruginosavorus]|nr:hypothetical protein [Micavibrio aeruginosavorus]